MVKATQSKLHSTHISHGDVTHIQNLSNSKVSLKEWKTLNAVVSCGSYAGAAEFLQISQPAVSYTITKLEGQLGIPLLKLEGRKAKITEPGIALLERARALLQSATTLEEFAESLRKTWKPEIRLAIDHTFPTQIVIPAIRMFSANGCNAKVTLIEDSPTRIEQILHEGAIDVAISSHVPSGFTGDFLIETDLVPVACPGHPIFRLNRALKQADLDNEVQIVIKHDSSDGVRGNKEAQPKITSHKLWEISNFDTAESALIEGLGYAWLPRHRVQKMVECGKLKILPHSEAMRCKSRFFLIHGHGAIPKCETVKLTEVLRHVIVPA